MRKTAWILIGLTALATSPFSRAADSEAAATTAIGTSAGTR